MIKNIICIECPKGCCLSVDMENRKVTNPFGKECPKGEKYAVSEIENPVRILTAAVMAEGLDLKMVPVKTDRPVPKAKLIQAMDEIKKIRLTASVRAGDVIINNFLDLDAKLIATRDAFRAPNISATPSSR